MIDIIISANYASLPTVGESGKLYLVLNDETIDNLPSTFVFKIDSYVSVGIEYRLSCPDCDHHLSSIEEWREFEIGDKILPDWVICPICDEALPIDKLVTSIRVSPIGNLWEAWEAIRSA